MNIHPQSHQDYDQTFLKVLNIFSLIFLHSIFLLCPPVNSYLSLPVNWNIPTSITPSFHFMFVLFHVFLLLTLCRALVTETSGTASQPKLLQFFFRHHRLYLQQYQQDMADQPKLLKCSFQNTTVQCSVLFAVCLVKCVFPSLQSSVCRKCLQCLRRVTI